MSSFAEQNFPNLRGGKDYAFFDFPIINPKWGKPVVGGGDLLIVFKDRPQVRKLVRYMAGKEASTIWASAKKGAIVSPNKNVPFSVYSSLKRREAQQLTEAENFVFDGSDLTPSAVGGDGMVIALQEFVADPERVREILSILEDVAARSY